MPTTGRLNGWLYPALAALALAGAAVVLFSTRLGPGLADDSYFYIQPGQAWLSGAPFQVSALFPPLLTYLLAGLGWLGLDAMLAARLTNAISFGATGFLAGLATRRSGASAGFALLAAVLVLTAEQLLQVFAWAMSEPLYLALVLAALINLGHYKSTGRRGAFWAALVFSGLAGLTRYLGVSLIGAGALVLLLWPGQPLARRLRDALIYGFGAVLPVILFVASNALFTGEPFGHRAFALSPYQPHYTRGALNAVLSWFLPGRVVNGREVLLAGLALLAVSGVAAWFLAARRARPVHATPDRPRSVLPLALGLFIGLNLLILGLLLFTRGIIAPGESYSSRYLSPVLAATLILLAVWLDRLWRIGRSVERMVLLASVLALLLLSVYRAQDTARSLAQTSGGYNSPRWHISETMRYLNLHPEVELVSTANYGIYFWTGSLPRSIGDFRSPEELQAYLEETGGFLVLIDSMPPEVYGFNTDSLVDGLVLHQRFSEGSIYIARP